MTTPYDRVAARATGTGRRLHPGGGESSTGRVSAPVQPALRGARGSAGISLSASGPGVGPW